MTHSWLYGSLSAKTLNGASFKYSHKSLHSLFFLLNLAFSPKRELLCLALLARALVHELDHADRRLQRGHSCLLALEVIHLAVEVILLTSEVVVVGLLEGVA